MVSRFDTVERALSLAIMPQQRVVLAYLALRMRTSGRQSRQTWVKQRQIAEALRMPERNVRRHVDALVAGGHLQRWRQPHGYLYRLPASWDETDAFGGVSGVAVTIGAANDRGSVDA